MDWQGKVKRAMQAIKYWRAGTLPPWGVERKPLYRFLYGVSKNDLFPPNL